MKKIKQLNLSEFFMFIIWNCLSKHGEYVWFLSNSRKMDNIWVIFSIFRCQRLLRPQLLFMNFNLHYKMVINQLRNPWSTLSLVIKNNKISIKNDIFRRFWYFWTTLSLYKIEIRVDDGKCLPLSKSLIILLETLMIFKSFTLDLIFFK